jgi:hypothetical protein
LELLVLSITADHVGVSTDACLNLRILEVDDSTVLLEQVDLFDSRNAVYSEALEGALKTLVV